MAKGKVRVGLVGLGNCASSFIQGLGYYAEATADEPPPGLVHVELGGYHVADVTVVSAFDIHAGKVGRDIADAAHLPPNNTLEFARFSHAIPEGLTGWSVLDIGCNAGFYSLEMKRRGAARVLGIDFDDRYLDQARLAAEVCGAEIELRKLSVYDLAALGERFDLVIFMGVLYHLRHPLLALDLIHEHVARDLLLFQSMQRGTDEVAPVAADYDFSAHAQFDEPGYPKLHFIEHQYSGDWTNWWAPNSACSAAMLRSSGFEVVNHPESEVFICRRVERPTPAGAVYPMRPQDGAADA